MKVIRDSAQHLIVENNPIWIAVLICSLALVFIGAGLFVMRTEFWIGLLFVVSGGVLGVVFNLAFTRRTQVIFDRPAGTVLVQRRSLLGYSTRRWALADLSRAEVQASRSGDRPTYRAALVFEGGMDRGVQPLTLAYYSGNGARNAAAAINDWLHRAP